VLDTNDQRVVGFKGDAVQWECVLEIVNSLALQSSSFVEEGAIECVVADTARRHGGLLYDEAKVVEWVKAVDPESQLSGILSSLLDGTDRE
jgi:hypothetical protein